MEILIVAAGPATAADAAILLRALGCRALPPVSTAGKALVALDARSPAAVLLGEQIGEAEAAPLLAALKDRAIPCAVLGLDGPTAGDDIPYLPLPVSRTDLGEFIERVRGKRPAAA